MRISYYRRLTYRQMSLPELRVNTTNKGRFVLARRIGKLNLGYTTLTAGFEDEEGNVGLLTIDAYNFPNEDLLPPRSVFAIKEPHYTLAVTADARENVITRRFISVQHISDLVILRTADPRIAAHLHTIFVGPVKDAIMCKDEGDRALGTGELIRALNVYTNGDLTNTDAGFSKEILHTRALVNLRLGRFDAAICDALASLSHGTNDSSKIVDGEAHHRAGLAAYQLGSFEIAKAHFEAHLHLNPSNESSRRELKRVAARESEQTGLYDFGSIVATLSPAAPRVDAASFTARVDVRDSPGKGRGLFAKQRINMGDLVLCEKALWAVYSQDPGSHRTLKVQPYRIQSDRVTVGAAHRVLMKKLFDNPSLIEKVLGLSSGKLETETFESVTQIVDGMPVLDHFQINNIFNYNSFDFAVLPDADAQAFPFANLQAPNRNEGVGIWHMASFINHACNPNACRCFIGDLLVLRATRDIKADEEITHSYISTANRKDLQISLKNSWDFTCTCPLCEAEAATTEKDKAKREQSLARLNLPPGPGQDRLEVLTNVVRKMKKTYGQEYVSGMPKTEMQELDLCISIVHFQRGNYDKAANSVINSLRCWGVGVCIGTDTVTLDWKYCIVVGEIVFLLRQAAAYKAKAGHSKMSAELEKLARECYVKFNGTMHGFEQAKWLRFVDISQAGDITA